MTNEYDIDAFSVDTIDGIVYIKHKDSDQWTAYLASRPGVVCQTADKSEVPFLIKEILDSIDGWDD